MAVAQRENLFTIDAQVRARGEYDNSLYELRSEGDEPAFYVNNRTRISLGYQRKNLEMKVAGQYTGIWGDDNIQKSASHLSLNEAWGRLHFDPGFFVQVGRMPISYDDEWLLGASDWTLTGFWHDALRVGFENKTHQVHAFATYLQDNDKSRGGYYTQLMPYKQMQGLWYHLQLLPEMPLGVSLLVLNTGVEGGSESQGRTRWMQTMGGRVAFQPNHFDICASFYYQTGRDDAANKVGAFMGSARAAYNILNLVTVGAGYDYLSGNDGLNYNQHAFNPLFTSSHNFFGAMDYFSGRIAYGLQDINASVAAHFTKDIHFSVDWHKLSMAESVYGFNVVSHETRFSKNLGQEVDLRFKARIMKDVSLEAGYSMMFATRTLAVLQRGSEKSWQDWGWISLNINPRLLVTRW